MITRAVDPGDWPDVVADAVGPQLVLGGPGTGKTEFLVRRAAALAAEGRSVLLLVFSRRDVEDALARLRRVLEGPLRGVEVTTFHSLGLRIVERHARRLGWAGVPRVLSAPEHAAFVRRLLAREDPRRWPVSHRGLLTSPTFADEIADFVLRAREGLLTADDIAARERPDWRALPGFLERYDRALRAELRIDYGTLLADAATALADPAARTDGPEVVLVDEYQDTTPVQVALVRHLVADRGDVTVAADPDQAIYGFRGSDPGGVARFGADHAHLGTPRVLHLTTSFRVPAEILAAARRILGTPRPTPTRPAAGAGTVEAHRFDRTTEEADWIARELQRLHLEHRVPYREMAVFARSKRRFLPELSRALERRGIPHRRPDARLVDQPAVRVVLDLVAAVGDDPAAREGALRRLLLGSLFGLGLGAVRELVALDLPWPERLRLHVPDGGPLADLLEDPSWAVKLPAAEGLWYLWTHLPQLARIVEDPSRAADRAAWGSLAQVLARWNERNPEATLVDHLRLVETEDYEASPLLAYRPVPDDHVTIATLHEAKGRSFRIVFVADAVEGVLPDLRPRASLLDAAMRSRDAPEDAAAVRRLRLDEERRLAYTAATRAARRVVWTASAAAAPHPGRPSRFLPLALDVPSTRDLGPPPSGRRPPITRREFGVELRRIAADPAEPPPRRLAAVELLAAGAELGIGDPARIPGVRRRGPDRGIVAPPLRLSPSQAEAYATCPRRYVLERRLGVRRDTLHAALGILVHEILEAVEHDAFARGDPKGTREEALAELDRRFDPGAFGIFAEAWRRRARELLDRLYRHWPSEGRVVAVERSLAAELDGVTWGGRADRIERREAGLVVVDLKTSTRPPTLEEAAASIQLGFYLWAARRTLDEPVVGAELWYPAAAPDRVVVRFLDEGRLDEILDRMRRIAAGIAEEDWRPTPGTHCRHCPVAVACPARPEGRALSTA